MSRNVLKQHATLFNWVLRGSDLLIAGVAAWAAFYGYQFFGDPRFWANYWLPIATALLLVTWTFPRFGLYHPWRGASIVEEIRRVSLAWGATFLVLATLAVITKTAADYSRIWFGLWFVLGWCGFVASRISLRLFLIRTRRRGRNLRTAIVVGGGSLAKEVVERLQDSDWTGIRVVGWFSSNADEILGEHTDLPRLGSLDGVSAYSERAGIDQIWIALPLRDEDRVQRLLHDLRHSTASIRYIPDIFGFRLLNHSVTEVAGLPVVNISVSPLEGPNWYIKRVEDAVFSLLILVLISPLLLLIAIGVKLSSPGPVFYRQERVGWNGRPFQMLKFRSMPVHAEDRTGPVWAKKGEDRATPFGAFLRRSSLDELPQFINVLKGEMSIVGPRPERPVFVEKFKDEIPDYMKKHLVKAGITGWAQVNGWRGDTDLEKRIEHDLYYIENWSLWFDIKIILLTLIKGFVDKNAY
jgi:putative colanic acid biosynthesis UDP-glucose lipid carrier transferase